MTIMLMENRENGDARLKNELAKKVDITPNRNMVRKNFIYKIVTDMLVYGNAVVYPEIRGGLLENMEIWNMDSVFFDDVPNGYRIRYKGAVFEPDEVLHFVLNPDDDKPYKGQGYAPMIKGAVENLLQANATKTAFLRSKWKPSLIISINADIQELQDEEMRRKILGSYAKETEQGEPWLIPAGEIDIKTIQPLTLNDLAIQDSIKLDKGTIAAAFGVPAFMVGIGDFDKEAYNNFISTEIMSVAMIIQQTLTKGLLYSPTMYFKFNPKSLLQYNLTEKVQFVKEMVAGGMLNRNEGRTEFDYAPSDNPGMNEYIVLENYVPVDKVGDQKKLVQEGENNE